MKYTRSIFKIFAKSPFPQLQAHAKKSKEAVHRLEELIDAYCKQDAKKVEEICEEISNLEYEADLIKQDIRTHLPSSLLMPVNRQDLLEFLKPQDIICDRVQDVARIATFKEPEDLPPDVKEGLIEMVKMVSLTVDAYEKAVSKINDLLLSSFRKKEIDIVLKLIPPVERLEHETDIVQIDLTKKIYSAGDKIGTLGVFHLSQMVSTMDEIADGAARASDRLRAMIYS